MILVKSLCVMLAGLLVCQGAWSEEISEAVSAAMSEEEQVTDSFPRVLCRAEQTGGFHDYPEEGESYEPYQVGGDLPAGRMSDSLPRS